MTAQVLFFDVFSEKDPHLNAMGREKTILVGMYLKSKYLKSIANISVIQCDEIITVTDIESIKKTNTIALNFMSTASKNCHRKKVRDYSILHTVLLAIILLLIIIIICYHYAKQKGAI